MISGGGLAGLASAYLINRMCPECEVIIVEREKDLGGLLRSYQEGSYTIDQGGHVLHNLEKIPIVFLDAMTDECRFYGHIRKTGIFIRNDIVPYPFQIYFYMHKDLDLVKECFLGIIKGLKNKITNNTKEVEKQHLEEYIVKYLGKGIYKWFMKPYNEKLWGINIRSLDYEEMKKFIPDLSIDDYIEVLERVVYRIGNSDLEKYTYSALLSGLKGYNTLFLSLIHI